MATITPTSYAATEQVSVSLKNNGLSIADTDAASSSMTVTLAVTEGTLAITAGSSGAVVTNSGTSSVTITGTVAQINDLLNANATSTVSYIDATDTPGASATLTLTVNDNGNTGTGGSLVSVDTATITITAVNDAPIFAPTASILTLVTNAAASGAVSFTEAALAAYFTDPDSATIGINTVAAGTGVTSATGTSLGAANVGTTGTVTITDNATLSGQFTVTATDGSATSSAATVTFTNNAATTTSLTAAASGDSIIVNDTTSASTLTGGAGSDYIIGNSGADIIVGAQNDKVLDGGGGTADILRIGANFASTSDAQIVNIENVTLTAAGTTLNLANQTEGFTITGSSGADTITGGSGADTITGGVGADTMTGGAGADIFIVNTGQSTVTLGGSGNAGTIAGYDIITDFATGSDTLNLQGTAAVAANTAATNGADSTLTIGGQTVKSHAITNGIVTFDDNNTFNAGSILSLTSLANVAAAVDYLNGVDIGTTGSTVAFTANIGGVAHTYIYEQLSTGIPSATNYLLVDLENVTLTSGGTSLSSLISAGRIAPAGVAGEPINLALKEPADHVGAVTVTVHGLPEGWNLSEGRNNGDGTWTVETHDVGGLSITTPANYTGAASYHVEMSWTHADGSSGIATAMNNVEAYAQGNPIFAIAGDDNLTGSSGSDIMVFAQPIGRDTVHNFDIAHDQVDLLGFAGTTNYAEVQAALANDADGNAVLSLGDGMSITFKGVDKSDLGASNFLFDQQPITINTGSMVLSNGSIMPFSGIIENTGTIALEATSNITELQIIQHGLTLQGGGSLLLSDSPGNLIFGTDTGVTFTNVDNLISGAGQLGGGQLTLVNQGTITGSGFYALDIDTGENTVVNSGVLESSGTGGLVVHGDIFNSGLLWANGGSFTVEGDVTGGGSALIDGNGTFVFDGLFSSTVAINDAASGTLMLTHSAQFAGSITGFDGNDHIFLGDISADAATLKYTENADGNGGVLTIADATHAANITLQGQYDALEFQFATHATGGTSITVVPHSDHLG